MIEVVDLEKLTRVLEDPRMYDVYRRFVPGEVVDARVGSYKHPDGVKIGDETRWLYVTVTYKLGDGTGEYDIALWKILARHDEIPEELKREIASALRFH